MKVPFLQGRIKEEFSIYLKELGEGAELNIKRASIENDNKIFFAIYPLFALLRCLSSSRHTGNSVKDLVLGELQFSGDKNKFIEAIKFFNKPTPFDIEMKHGQQRQIFTGFFNELFSDALLFLNSYYSANYRGANIALRCMCEDLYRHLFYLSHPQEFYSISKVNSISEYEIGISPQKLRDALPRLKYLEIFKSLATDFELKKSKIEKSSGAKASAASPAESKKSASIEGAREPVIFDLFDMNERVYSDASRAVHASDAAEHNSFRSNVDMKFSADRAARVLKLGEDFIHMCTAFLIAAHLDHVSNFDEYEKSLVMSGYSINDRGMLRKALNV